MNKAISIIIATYNAEKVLKRCLDSIVAQKTNDIEILIVDGDSTDSTMEIVQSYGSDIDYSLSEKDNGIYDAWNKALKVARGEWIMFLGADDYVLQDSVKVYLDFLKSRNHNHTDIICCRSLFCNEKGKVVAIVGYSGSGKTTISNLIQRFYDPNEGSITIDGIDLKDYDLCWIRRAIGFVAQEPTLYSTTIEDNVTYGVTEYTMEEFNKVCELANIDKFVNDKSMFPAGYKTLVGEKGARVSGGQKQRIAIARALMKNSKILVFDEATSALDAESENEV